MLRLKKVSSTLQHRYCWRIRHKCQYRIQNQKLWTSLEVVDCSWRCVRDSFWRLKLINLKNSSYQAHSVKPLQVCFMFSYLAVNAGFARETDWKTFLHRDKHHQIFFVTLLKFFAAIHLLSKFLSSIASTFLVCLNFFLSQRCQYWIFFVLVLCIAFNANIPPISVRAVACLTGKLHAISLLFNAPYGGWWFLVPMSCILKTLIHIETRAILCFRRSIALHITVLSKTRVTWKHVAWHPWFEWQIRFLCTLFIL